MAKPAALIIDDEPDICQLLAITLERMSIQAFTASNIVQAKKLLKEHDFSLCLSDMRLPDGDGLDFVSYIQAHHPYLPIAIITAHGNIETAIRALKAGAFDFICKPIDLPILREMVKSALKISNSPTNIPTDLLVGESQPMQELREKILKLARSQAPIYISGPSGSGKELVAKIIHQTGPRANQPFIPVNCGAIPQELMESEFFGHLKGSFSGASFDKIGFFQAADKGTLFLDEIADLPLAMQVKLLRAIQEKTIRPVGSPKEKSIDVRILSATHKDLSEQVKQNLFRQDLFYRLNVIELKVPSLKERQTDIPVLVQHILKKVAKQNNKPIPLIDAQVYEALSLYHFPGNIRELENMLERAFTLSNGKSITLADISLPSANVKESALAREEIPLDDYLIHIERQAIINAIAQAQGNKTAAAKLLGVSFRTLRYRLKKLGLDYEK